MKDILKRVSLGVREVSAYTVPDLNCKVKLDGNESPFDISSVLLEKITDEINKTQLNRYPDPCYRELRGLIAERSGISESNVLLGNGSDELILMLVESFTGKTGKVLVSVPTFSMYGITTRVMGRELIESDLDESFDLDTEDIRAKIEEHDPDLFFFASPNNPTGNSYTAERIEQVAESTTGIVVVDEAYSNYSGQCLSGLVKKHENVVVLRTLSKIGFAAIRLGMLFGSTDIVDLVNRTRLPYNINSLTEAVARTVYEIYLEQIDEHSRVIINEREKLIEELRCVKGIGIYPSDANFILLRFADSETVFNRLVERDILVRKLEGSERLRGCLRITVGKPDENELLVSALKDILSS